MLTNDCVTFHQVTIEQAKQAEIASWTGHIQPAALLPLQQKQFAPVRSSLDITTKLVHFSCNMQGTTISLFSDSRMLKLIKLETL